MNSLARIWAILAKELIQMRRDRMTFAMMIGIPIIQLILFGFAINTNPKKLPTAVYMEDNTPLTRAILSGLAQSNYFNFIGQIRDRKQAETLLVRGEASFVIYIPQNFTRQLIRQEAPQLLVEIDASDPAATSNAIGSASEIINRALARELRGSLSYLQAKKAPVELVLHRKYNPEGITQYNIVPGLLGVILTMTSVMITSMAMTRESEKGNLENILAMPSRVHEVMIGKIAPYVLVGLVQTCLILFAATFIFAVPFFGQLLHLFLGVLIFILANLCLGFTFSTIVRTQMQAMQLTFFFFLPSILLSGFMFPFRGMPDWAQLIGEALPLTHFLRIVRGIMLKGSKWPDTTHEFFAICLFIVFVGSIAVLRYRRTLD